MRTQALRYKDGSLECRGFLAEPDGPGPHPAVLVCHEAPGLTDHPRRRAQMLAELGYVAFAADMFGDGAEPVFGERVLERMGPLMQDRAALRERAGAALAALRALPNVDASRMAAVGYCFGGSTVLELARGGAALKGVASFHGGLETPAPAEPGAITAKIVIFTGAADPFIPAAHREAAQKEFTRAEVDWQMVVYSDARHSFTNVDCPPGREEFAYYALADARSWRALCNFLDEIFA